MSSRYLLYLQIILLAAMFYIGNINLVLNSGILTIIITAGIVIGLWAYYNMGSKIYSPFPEPKKNGKIVQKGLYKYVRHPMYLGMILIALSLFLTNLQFTTFLVFAVLLYVLDAKANLEEQLLTKMHSEYKDYTLKTKKFIPFVY